MELSKLQKIVFETFVSKGVYSKWNKARNILKKSDEPNLTGIVTLAELALVHSEVSDAREEIRNIDKEKMAKELAGLCIRIMCLAENQEIDLEKFIVMEDERNKPTLPLHNRKML